MDFRLTEEQTLIQDTARAWARDVLAPAADRLDREERFPLELMGEMSQLGLIGMMVPENAGGIGAGTVSYALAMMEIAGACASSAVTMAVTNMVAEAIWRFGDDTLRERYIPSLVEGRFAAGAFSLSEAGSGSDAAALSTTAQRDGDSYLLDGTKMWLTSGQHAGVVIVMARVENGQSSKAKSISAFLVEPDTPGYSVTRKEDKMGLRASETCVIALDECRIPTSQRLGAEGEGFKIAMKALDSGRIGVASQALGIATAAMKAAARYAGERRQFGKPIAKFQAIQCKLADMATEIEAGRWMALRAAYLKDQGRPFSKEAAMAKVFCTELAWRACEEALQIHGGYGYTREFPLERYLRDVRVTRIYEGTSEIQRLVIARELLKSQ